MTSLIHAFFFFFCGHLGEGQSLRRELALLTAQGWGAQGRAEELGGEKQKERCKS